MFVLYNLYIYHSLNYLVVGYIIYLITEFIMFQWLRYILVPGMVPINTTLYLYLLILPWFHSTSGGYISCWSVCTYWYWGLGTNIGVIIVIIFISQCGVIFDEILEVVDPGIHAGNARRTAALAP